MTPESTGFATAPEVRSWAMSMRSIVWLVALVAIAVWPLTQNSYRVFLAISAVVAAIVVLSVGVVLSDAGLPSLCQLAFAATSAWVYSRFAAAGHPLPLLIEALIAIGVAGAFGAVVGIPALRLRSVNLAVVTLGLATAVDTFINAEGFPTTVRGMRVDRPDIIDSDERFYVFSLAVFVVIAVALHQLRRRRIGFAWHSVRHSERATAAMGYSVARSKVSALVVSAMVSGTAGVLAILQLAVTDSSTFPPVQSIIFLALGLFVGAGRWQGALFAGVLSVVVPELLRQRGWSLDWSNLLFGVGAIQVLSGGRSLADTIWPRHRPAIDVAPNGAAWATARDASRPRPTPAASDIVLSTEDLTVRYGGVVACADVSLTVPAHAIVGIVGANGAGKTSLVDALSGYVPYDGSVTLAGEALVGPPHRRARAGLRRTFQQDRVVRELTVAQYLRLAARRDLPADEIDRLCAFAGVAVADARIDQLEGATRRLVEVAGAFASGPAVVLLDEPVAGLSAAEAIHFASRLRDAPAVFDCAVVLIEHDIEFVRHACTTAVALDFGAVIATGTPDAVLADPRVRSAYLGLVG